MTLFVRGGIWGGYLHCTVWELGSLGREPGQLGGRDTVIYKDVWYIK